MRHLSCLFVTGMILYGYVHAQSSEPDPVQYYEYQLADVMEVIDTNVLKEKCSEVETNYQKDPVFLSKARLGIIYHEMALNFMFLTHTSHTGYARKSYDLLNSLCRVDSVPSGLSPFIASYRASALSLVAAETRDLKLLSQAFQAFHEAVDHYADVSYCPEFMRGSVAENLPWYFFRKRKYAKQDFESIINKYEKDTAYASEKIMSFTYWAWANQHQGKKYRKQALNYLQKAITLDPDYQAGRLRAETLWSEMENGKR